MLNSQVDFLVSLVSCEGNFTTETLNLNISFTKYAGQKAKKVVFGAVLEPFWNSLAALSTLQQVESMNLINVHV